MNADSIQMHCFVLGQWMTNCHVVAGADRRCWFIDGGFDPEPMIDFVQAEALDPQGVLLTHAHVDHIAGLSRFREIWPDLPILIHATERDYLGDPQDNLSAALATPIRAPEPTGILATDTVMTLADHAFAILHTPGHSPGGITLYAPDLGVAFVGDTLFNGSIGRTDFPHSDQEALMRSIHTSLMSLPDHTRVLPGHGPETTIGAERQSNPFLQ